ncbi:MAG: hypothetical protein WCX83_03965, partial [Candidatus Cloacimonas sp.]|nr:hypothetical protein [Candidatus Cloacimonadota bacterium]
MKHGYFKYLLLSLILLTSTLALHAGLIFYEDFDASTELPAGWTTAQTESAYSADIVWRIDDYASWYGGNFSNNCAAYDEPYNYYYSDPNLKAHLTTPAIDCTGHSNVTLVWDNYADVYAYLGVGADVLISNDGENWHRIKRYQDYHTAEQEIIDISEYAANKSTVYVRWSWDAYLYYWAIDNVQLLSFSDEPLPVVLNKPDDGAINLPLETNLTWTPSNLGNQPTGYKVYLDTVNPPEAMVYDGTDKTCSPTLAYDTEYFWRVIPYNEHGSTATEDCVVRSFRTYPAEPLPALLVGPANNEVDVHPYKTLIWEAQKEGFKPVGYKVYMDTNNPPETLVYEGSNTSFDPEFDFNTQYYWRVIPYSADAETKTEDCDIWSFKTTDLYSAPYSQPFNGFRPAGWKTEELTGRYPTNLFVFNNPGGREPDGNFDEDFATYDRKNTGGVSSAKPALITPPIDCREASNVTIGYDQFHMNDFYTATYEVHVSTDGINWTLLRKATTPTNVAERYHFNISDIAVGQKTVYVRWHAYSSVHYYAIDNVDFIVYEGVPHAATLATPADGTDDLPLSTKLTWVAPVLGPEVDGYKVYIDTMDPPEAFFDVGNVLEYSPTLAYDTKYYWQVVPYNSSGDTDREDCETWTLKTYAAEPLPVVVVSPKNNAEHITVGSTIEWTANAKGIRPTGYKIRLDTVTPPGNEVDLGDLTTYTPGFASNTTYYWRVIPYSADGEADLEHTTIYNFTTSQPNPYAANVEAPRNGATYVPVSQKLQWSHSAIGEQATGYKVYLDTTNPPTTEVYNGSDTVYAADLDFDTEYFWQVVPYNGAGDATDCLVWSFTTSPVFNLPFTENFNASTSTPVGWTNEQLAADKASSYVWRFDNPYGQYMYGDISGNFPIFDNEYFQYEYGLQTAITTPAIDCSEETKVNLSYDYFSYVYSGNVDVLVSTDRENWTRVRRYNDWEYGNENLDISEHAAGNKTVYVR